MGLGSGDTVFINTTFSENIALEEGGAIYSETRYAIEHGTFYRNIANNAGGALRAFDEVSVGSSVFYENIVNGAFNDFENVIDIRSLGFNFITSVGMNRIVETSTDLLNPTDAERANFGIDELTPNVGSIASHPLLPNSALINAGASAETGNADSRGVIRDAFPDVGAHEAETASSVYYLLDDQDRVLRGDLFS